MVFADYDPGRNSVETQLIMLPDYTGSKGRGMCDLEVHKHVISFRILHPYYHTMSDEADVQHLQVHWSSEMTKLLIVTLPQCIAIYKTSIKLVHPV